GIASSRGKAYFFCRTQRRELEALDFTSRYATFFCLSKPRMSYPMVVPHCNATIYPRCVRREATRNSPANRCRFFLSLETLSFLLISIPSLKVILQIKLALDKQLCKDSKPAQLVQW